MLDGHRKPANFDGVGCVDELAMVSASSIELLQREERRAPEIATHQEP